MDNSDIEHLAAIEGILKRFKAAGLSLYQHEYFPLAFGSFTMIIGSSHERLKIEWDGKESVLCASHSTFSGQSDVAAWQHVLTRQLASPKDLYKELAEIIAQYLVPLV